MTKDERRNAWGWALAWTLVYPSNLIVPLQLGWPICGPYGKIGLALAVACYGVMGLIACFRRSSWGHALVSGGVVMALLQFWPLAQFTSGMIALKIWSDISANERPLTMLGGFVVTGLTGAILQVMALLCGSIFVMLPSRPSKAKPDFAFRDEL